MYYIVLSFELHGSIVDLHINYENVVRHNIKKKGSGKLAVILYFNKLNINEQSLLKQTKIQ